MTIDEYRREFPNCAICLRPGIEVHHIWPKGMGGSKERDIPENWISLCHSHHMAAHCRVEPYLSKEFLFEVKKRVERKKREEVVFGAKGGLAHLQEKELL